MKILIGKFLIEFFGGILIIKDKGGSSLLPQKRKTELELFL
jgi:hypothetical protein